jgi:hypothetical protein
MEFNREEIIKALECHANGCKCGKCPMSKRTKEHHSCWTELSQGALALINELTTERDGLKNHNDYLQGLVDNAFIDKIKDFNSPSAAKAVAEAEMWQRIALREKELVEENERLHIELLAMRCAANSYKTHCEKLSEEILNAFERGQKQAQVDTVRKMHQEIKDRAFNPNNKFDFIYDEIGQIAKEFLEEN